MSETRSDAVPLDGQHVELLPARTVLSTFARAADEDYGNADAGSLDSLIGQLPSVDNVATPGGDNGVGGAVGHATKGI